MPAHTLPALPWARDALQPHISQETIDYHYGKHHQTYVTKLNGLVEQKPELEGKSLEELMEAHKAGGPVFNNAAQIWNHTFYWNSLSPNGGGAPTGAIGEKINAQFGSFEKFQEQFTGACVNHFGSGWAWLCLNKDGSLSIDQTHDAGCPLLEGKTPLLTCDVWEHAYYVDYRNVRPDYVKAWWNLVNWEFANKNMRTA